MADKSKAAPGQQKTHTATRINPESGVSESKDFTQAEWRQRDKTAGWTRPDGVEDDDEDGGGTESGGTTSQS
jgi:hypothetical protein